MRYNPQHMNHRPRRRPFNRRPQLEALEARQLLAAVAFAAPVNTSLNTSEYDVTTTVVGDVNDDSIPDIVVGHDDGSGQVFLGNTTGTFTPGVLVGPGAQVLAMEDFNNDGNLDLATAVGVLPGNGDGTFGATPSKDTYVLPANTVALDAADINGDGNADLIAVTLTPVTVSGQNSSSQTQEQTLGVSVMLGNGDGSFQAPVSTVLGTAPDLNQSFANVDFDDFNNDGVLDCLSAFGVSLGNANGSFGPPISFPQAPSSSSGSGGSSGSSGAGSSASTTPALPAYWAFAVDDFNGDGNLDVALVPPAGSPAGQIEILLGNGDGTFIYGTPVSLGSSAVITALGSGDVNSDGNTDLIVGQTSSDGNSSAIDVLTGNGDGTFGAPESYSLPGVPLSVEADDFNADGYLDLLAIEAPAGSSLAQTRLPAANASVLLNSKTTPVNPTITIASSAPRVVAGVDVTFSVAVQSPPPTALIAGQVPTSANQPVPTGSVEFMEGTTSLGTVQLKNGRAKLTSALTGVGVEKVTAVYSGDTTYAGVTSSPLNETVLLTTASTPLLVPALTTVTAPTVFLAKDTGSITLTLTNGGGAVARGKLSVDLFLSATKTIGASAIALTAAALQNRSIALGVGQSTTLTGKFTFGSYTPGAYYLIAELVPISTLTSSDLTTATLVDSQRLQAAGMVFGTVGTHQNLTLTVTDSSGDQAKLSMTGGGYGTVTQTNGLTDIALTGTSTSSKLVVTPLHATTFSFDTLTDPGAMASITGTKAIITGGLTLGGTISSITLAGVGDGGSTPLTLSVGGTVTLSLGTVAGVTLNSTEIIKSLTASSWQGGQIIAPSIQTLTVKGAFDPDVETHGTTGKITTATLGTINGGTWAISGGIGTLHVTGNLSDASIYAGADAGSDDVLGTSDDLYRVASITTVFVGGADTSSVIAAGAAPLPGETITSGLTLLPKGQIGTITVRGTVSDDSRFLAAVLPKRANLTGALVATATDPNFQV